MTGKAERSQAVDKKPVSADLRLLELHYFRVPRERWELMLTRLHQMGAKTIRTVVPWSWHEPRDNVFDLTGVLHPTRDLTGFVETCVAFGFQVVLRVGPYLEGAGLLGGGVPGWLLKEHPDTLALGPDAQPRRNPTSGEVFPSAAHPTYLKYVERWYRELVETLSARQWPEGSVVSMQVDGPRQDVSELGAEGVPTGWDYNPHVVKAQWPVWLRQQYDGIDALNAAWGTDYRSFGDAAFPDGPPTSKPSSRWDDAERFVTYSVSRATESYARMLQQIGWTLPALTPAPAAIEMAHASQVDPEPAEIGAAVQWAMDAPVRPDGCPRRQFWAVKGDLLEMKKGVKQVEGGTMVAGPDSRRVRLPQPAGDYRICRLLLDGRLIDVPGRTRGDTLYVDYLAVDAEGPTDMYLVIDDVSVPLTGLSRDYLRSLLVGMAQAMRRTGLMCQALAEALAGAPSRPGGGASTTTAAEDLRVAEHSLAEARLAAYRAAASLGQLENLASEIRGEGSRSRPTPTGLLTFTSQELEHLVPVRDACAQAGPALAETARAITALCQQEKSPITVKTYRAAWERLRATGDEAETMLASALGSLRADLAAGTLPPSSWAIQDWLTRILQGLAAGLLRIGN